ncbi:MAG TPA: Arm DNA-binding domain-containing protein, partial [Burkholderiales bacterium]|nr:Arm DNA-binding domain-containing protein [Burkholderiales bacterium]
MARDGVPDFLAARADRQRGIEADRAYDSSRSTYRAITYISGRRLGIREQIPSSIPSKGAIMAGAKGASDIKFRNARASDRLRKVADRDGLYLHIMPSGAKSWRYDYRIAGARQTLTIGRYPDVSLGAARVALNVARGLIAQGM